MLQIEPLALWNHFEALSKIPRCSGNESQAAQYVLDTAARLGLDSVVDESGNVVVRKPGVSCSAKAIPVVLQAHLDMVCEKTSDSAHDFSQQGLTILESEGWVSADQTSLGADNGIGVAAALAILESESLIHPPLEFLATVEEEVGLVGASRISSEFVNGRHLINLDGEQVGTIIIGCAGGLDLWGKCIFKCIPPIMTNGRSIRFSVSGLLGGHSGVDIHKGRGNAVKLLAHSLLTLRQLDNNLSIITFSGGSKSNAIPRSADAVAIVDLSVSDDELAAWEQRENDRWQENLRRSDASVRLSISPAETAGLVYTPESTRRFLEQLSGLPHGVAAIDAELGVVESSSNLAIARATGGNAEVLVSIRSSRESDRNLLMSQAESVMKLCGMNTAPEAKYPAWPPAPQSHLLSVAQGVHMKMFDGEATATAIHAGLECGILSERLAGMEAISIGPQIVDAHSPDERVSVPSVARFFAYLMGILEAMAVQ